MPCPAARHRGCAFGDLDGDGRVDVVVTALSADAEIWMNRSEKSGHWLDIALRGTKSNRDGIGARIKVVTKSGTQYNHMTTSVGYASSSDGPVHFGLGSGRARGIDRDSLAVGGGADAGKCRCRPGFEGHGSRPLGSQPGLGLRSPPRSVSLRPFGACSFSPRHPRLAPWAAFFAAPRLCGLSFAGATGSRLPAGLCHGHFRQRPGEFIRLEAEGAGLALVGDLPCPSIR